MLFLYISKFFEWTIFSIFTFASLIIRQYVHNYTYDTFVLYLSALPFFMRIVLHIWLMIARQSWGLDLSIDLSILYCYSGFFNYSLFSVIKKANRDNWDNYFSIDFLEMREFSWRIPCKKAGNRHFGLIIATVLPLFWISEL